MPRTKSEKRSAGAIGSTFMIGRIATARLRRLRRRTAKNAAAVRWAHGREGAGGRDDAKNGQKIAKKAALKRWRG